MDTVELLTLSFYVGEQNWVTLTFLPFHLNIAAIIDDVTGFHSVKAFTAFCLVIIATPFVHMS